LHRRDAISMSRHPLAHAEKFLHLQYQDAEIFALFLGRA
jgi:hypothetical protein